MPDVGFLISHDLFFASKVTGTAQALGFAVRSASTLDPLRSLGADDCLRLLILDLDCPGMTPENVIAAIPAGVLVNTVAFGPHVHEDQLAAARSAGFQQVMPRSRFSAELVAILKEAFDSM